MALQHCVTNSVACHLARILQIPIIPKIDPRRFICPSRCTGFVRKGLKRMSNRQTLSSRAGAHCATLARLLLDHFTMNSSRIRTINERWKPTRKRVQNQLLDVPRGTGLISTFRGEFLQQYFRLRQAGAVIFGPPKS